MKEDLRGRLFQFLSQLEEAAFGIGSTSDKELFMASLEWIDILKKIV
jgi:hypothetical protein